MLGLRRHTVHLTESNRDWPHSYDTERARIIESTDTELLQVEHIGSTAVPGLPAKPILDVGVLVASDTDLKLLQRDLPKAGYLDRGDKGPDGGYLFVRESQPNVRTHHVHILKQGDPAWSNYLRFRDALRDSEELRHRYASLKQTLAGRFPIARSNYTEAKTNFIHDTLASLARG